LWNALLTHQVAVSENRLQLLLGRSGAPANRASVIYGCADTERFCAITDEERPVLRSRLGIPSKCTTLLGVGHLGLIKGHDISIRALPAILKEYPDAHLFLAGTGPIEDQLRIQRLIEELGLADRVHLLGPIDNPEAWMAASDVFVQPPRDEAFGLVFAEASSASCAIVATDVGGIPEIVKHGDTGILVPSEDVGALSSSVIRLLNDPGLRTRMGASARSRALTHFSTDAMASAYAGLVRCALRGPSSAEPLANLHAASSIDAQSYSGGRGTTL